MITASMYVAFLTGLVPGLVVGFFLGAFLVLADIKGNDIKRSE